MKLNELSPNYSQTKKKKRIGRGVASGHGVTSGRGHKGSNSRSGGRLRFGFEGGQMPLHRRLPKRGFTNIFKKKYQIVNLKEIAKFDFDSFIDINVLMKKGLVNSLDKPVKILGYGDINKIVKVKVNKVSASAKVKIEACGGKVEEVG